jgi:hypothetical protein
MRPLALTAILFLSALPLSGAAAGTPTTQKMACPIGGKEFDFTTTASYSTFGSRPDGKPYGSWTFPLALPECPDNGLVLYKEYDAAEVAKLEPLVASEAYRALLEDTPYYRAYWLMREMGLGPDAYLWALLQASWEADSRPELKARYQAELVEASAKVTADPASTNWVGMEGRAINALRELGRFDEALARLDKLPASVLTAPAAAAPAGKAGETMRARKVWADYFKALRGAIERKDSSSEPLDLLPRREALSRCIESGDTLGDHGRSFCTGQSAAVEQLRAARAQQEAELKALATKGDKSGR